MPLIDENYVKVCGCTIIWDGITNPDLDQNGQPKYKLKLAVPSGSGDLTLLDNLANTTLQASQKFNGVLPAGGRMPITSVQAGEYNNLLQGYVQFNAKTNKLPDVYSEQGQLLDILQYGQLLFSGQQVDVLVHCYDYDNMGNKGIGIGLDGFAIISSAGAVRQSYGNGGINTQNVFGGGTMMPAQQPMGSPMPQYQQPPMQQQQPMQQPVGSPMPQYQQQPMQQQQQPMHPYQQQPMQQQQPVQAHNMLPQ